MTLTPEQRKKLSSEMRSLRAVWYAEGGAMESMERRIRTLETIVEILLRADGVEPLVYDWEKRR